VANHPDALKRAKQAAERRLRNRSDRTLLRNQIKKLREAIESGDAAAAKALLPETTGIIQHTAQKGVIHKRNAARRVSRLALAVNGMATKE
jgi:small subunit ribosomal protein S20